MRATIRIEINIDVEGDENELPLLCKSYFSKADEVFHSLNPIMYGTIIIPPLKERKTPPSING
jgi:hypothetical protein